jgi:hypothetical protein
MFFRWKLEAEEAKPVEFPLSAGFGCGSTMKKEQGEKISLQKAHKLGGQIGTKLGIPGSELSATVSSELSETITYELTTSSEWSYTSRPCEYCFPGVRFPDARVRIFKKWTLRLPLFVIRKTIFLPGESYPEIHGNCRHDPERCQNCENIEAAPGAGPVATIAGSGGSSHLDRVQLAGREPLGESDDLKMVLKDILYNVGFPPEPRYVEVQAPDQFYLVDLAGRTQSVSRPDGHYLLYSLDDIDRSIGAVRLYPNLNMLLLITKAPEKNTEQPEKLKLELTDENGSIHQEATAKASATASGFCLINVELSLSPGKRYPHDLFLRVSHGDVTDEWPTIVLPSA